MSDAVNTIIRSLSIPSVGDTPFLTPADQNYYNTLGDIFGKAALGNKNPMWNDAEELERMRSLSFTQGIPNINGQINDRLAHRYPVSDLNNPRDTLSVLQTAVRYAYENPFVAKASRIKTDFTIKGMQHRTHNDRVKDFYDYQAKRLRLQSRLRKIVWQLYTIGQVPIWWGGEEGEPIRFLEILDPRMCVIESNFGVHKLYLRIDSKMLQAVADPNGRVDIRNKARFEAMPKYWVRQIEEQRQHMNKDMLLELQDGSYTVIENRYCAINRTISSLDGLPLQPAFDALQRYRLLTAGDFATAWSLKNMITLISEGDPKAEGKEWKPVSTARLSQLQSQFQRPDTSFTVYCDPTTEVRFVIPPVKDIFTQDKYLQVEKEIKEVLNLPSFMWASESGSAGNTYGNSVSEMKLLRMEVNTVRSLLKEEFFEPFYERIRELARGRANFKNSDITYPTFDQTSLEDDQLWLTSIPDLYGRGACSLQTLQETFGLDHEYEMEQLKIEHDTFGNTSSGDVGEPLNNTIAQPLFEPSQGNMNPVRDKGGNEGQSTPGARNPRSGKGGK